MKKFICVGFALCLFSTAAFAESSKITKVDLDVKTTHIIKADLGRDDLFYYMDLTACICWVSQSMGSSFAVSTFDCSKLSKHPKLEKYVADCGVKKEEPKKEEPKELVKEEVKKDEVKKEEPQVPAETAVVADEKTDVKDKVEVKEKSKKAKK